MPEDCELEDVGRWRSDAILRKQVVGEEEAKYGRELKEEEAN